MLTKSNQVVQGVVFFIKSDQSGKCCQRIQELPCRRNCVKAIIETDYIFANILITTPSCGGFLSVIWSHHLTIFVPIAFFKKLLYLFCWTCKDNYRIKRYIKKWQTTPAQVLIGINELQILQERKLGNFFLVYL